MKIPSSIIPLCANGTICKCRHCPPFGANACFYGFCIRRKKQRGLAALKGAKPAEVGIFPAVKTGDCKRCQKLIRFVPLHFCSISSMVEETPFVFWGSDATQRSLFMALKTTFTKPDEVFPPKYKKAPVADGCVSKPSGDAPQTMRCFSGGLLAVIKKGPRAYTVGKTQNGAAKRPNPCKSPPALLL